MHTNIPKCVTGARSSSQLLPRVPQTVCPAEELQQTPGLLHPGLSKAS